MFFKSIRKSYQQPYAVQSLHSLKSINTQLLVAYFYRILRQFFFKLRNVSIKWVNELCMSCQHTMSNLLAWFVHSKAEIFVNNQLFLIYLLITLIACDFGIKSILLQNKYSTISFETITRDADYVVLMRLVPTFANSLSQILGLFEPSLTLHSWILRMKQNRLYKLIIWTDRICLPTPNSGPFAMKIACIAGSALSYPCTPYMLAFVTKIEIS